MGCGAGSKNSTNVLEVSSHPSHTGQSPNPFTIVESPEVRDLKFRVGQFIQYHEGCYTQSYRTLKELGAGAYGKVYLVENKITKQKRAVKEIDKLKAERSPGGVSKFIKEVDLLAKLDHPHILKLYELFEDQQRYYVISEYLTGGELFDYIVSSGHLTEPQAARIMHQVLSAVTYCHLNSIVHRDLKPENLILVETPTEAETLNIKLIDFGTSCLFDNETKLKKRLGTPYYIAPEVLNMSYDEKCDVWSCGVLLYIFLSGYPPFTGKTDAEIMRKVRTGVYNFNHREFNQVSEESKAFIRKMLVLDTTERISAQEALNDPWLLKYATVDPSHHEILTSLHKLRAFRAETKLKQAVLTFITSQLLTEAEGNSMRQVFELLDKNGDGRLSHEELVTAYSRNMSIEEARQTVEVVMQKVDADKNGFINYSEFILATTSEHVLLSKENMEAAFRMFDKDGSGTITVQELKDMLGGPESEGSAVWQQLVKEADANGDGEIDIKEFKTLLLNIF